MGPIRVQSLDLKLPYPLPHKKLVSIHCSFVTVGRSCRAQDIANLNICKDQDSESKEQDNKTEILKWRVRLRGGAPKTFSRLEHKPGCRGDGRLTASGLKPPVITSESVRATRAKEDKSTEEILLPMGSGNNNLPYFRMLHPKENIQISQVFQCRNCD
ncbi:hypothetical protein RRG08_024367 [Elysia crispata]|uniref:Uncharacterized protein n=1 Tax=Elysia crispata TaxID=231223 RepID=A0AAE0ZL59_9GAST|nr:hypothetical protein RRG08_024367 [Elysia crispata]